MTTFKQSSGLPELVKKVLPMSSDICYPSLRYVQRGRGREEKRCDEYRLFLHRFSSGDQVNYQDDQGEHQQQVDESTQRITGHQPDQPQYQQNHKDCPQHCRVPPLQAMEIALLLEVVRN